MNHTLIIFALILTAFALSTWATVWSRRETRVRLASMLGFFIVLVGLGPASMEGLGFHRPMWAAWRLEDRSELLILGYKLIRYEGIYLYVDAGPGEPRAIMLPWDDDDAENVQKAARKSKRNGRTEGKMLFRAGEGGEFVFWPLPQSYSPPPKPELEQGRVYERR